MSTVLSLFEKLGGSTAVDAVVQKFYEYMLADKKVNHYFEHVDMTKQRLRQVQFITMVTGGPFIYQGKDMKAAHCKHNISKEEFDITWSHLSQALKFYNVIPAYIQELQGIFYSVQEDIVKCKENIVKSKEQMVKGKEDMVKQNHEGKTVSKNSEIQDKSEYLFFKKGCPFKEQVSLLNSLPKETTPQKLTNERYQKHCY